MNIKDKKRIALIYCRVSSERQKSEGHGLDSQEHRCRSYANQKGYEVEKVFRDSASGGGDFMRRPAMVDLLNYADKNAHKDYVVIFDDLSRFSRDVVFHFKLKTEFDNRHLKRECLNFSFEDSPEGEFIETILSAQNQYHRVSNRRQVIQKQKARLEKGYWPFFAPPGYKFIKDFLHGKLLIPDENLSSTIKEAFEGFESGILNSQVDVQNFLQSRNFSGVGKRVYLEKVKRLLTRPIYAGVIEYPDWEVSRRKGHHEAIISEETFDNVQNILNGKKRIVTRKDTREDFPLRGLISSIGSDKPYTASFSRGVGGKYPYYRDTDKNSAFFNKSLDRDVVEKHFKEALSGLKPSPELIDFTKAIFNEEWERRNDNKSAEEHEIQKEIALLETKIEKLTERSISSEKQSVVDIYERKIESAQFKKEELESSLLTGHRLVNFGTALDCVLSIIKNPLKQWKNGNLKQKRAVARTVFSGLAQYEPNVGFGTNNLAPIYNVFEAISTSNSQDVEVARIELACK